MAVFQGKSGLPEDQFVNTFHFTGEGTYDEDASLAAAAVFAFYNATDLGPTYSPVSSFLSPWLENAYVIKTYDMSIPPVRVPTDFPQTRIAPTSASGPPEEVAVTLTLHGSVPPASPRRRGRIYLGPLNNSAVVSSTATTRSLVHTSFIVALTERAEALVDWPLLTWCIKSVTPAVNYVPIVSGYVDNALDTQRRRGPDATVRTPFVGAP